jgi:hypothetical protein
MKRTIAACALAATLPGLGGCATGYHDAGGLLGYTGGYYDHKGPGDLYKVGFSGNAFVSADKVRDYLTYRCAEIARREGHAWFAIYRNLPDAIRDQRAASKKVGSMSNKPWGEVYILFFEKPEDGLLNADEVIARLKPVVENEGTKS